MSAAPGTSIYAEIVLKKDKALADAKTMGAELQRALNSVKLPDLKINFTIPTNLAQTLNTQLAALKLNPITVPVNFGLPGMAGAASPNWGYYFGQLQQQLAGMGRGGGGGGGVGGGPGAAPFLRGFGRLGSGLFAIHALQNIYRSGERFNTSMIEAGAGGPSGMRLGGAGYGQDEGDVRKELDAILQRRESLGGTLVAGPVGVAISNLLHGENPFTVTGDEQIASTLRDSALTDRHTKAMAQKAEQREHLKVLATEHELSVARTTGMGNEAAAFESEAAGDPQSAIQSRNRAEIDAINAQYAAKLATPRLTQQQVEDLKSQHAAALQEATAKQATGFATFQRHQALVMGGVGAGADVAGLRLAGREDEAARVALEQQQKQHAETLFMGPGGAAAQAAYLAKGGQADLERQGLVQQQGKGREYERAQSEARITEIENQSEDNRMRAANEHYKADEKAFADHWDAKVKAAQDKADAITDVEKKRNAQAEADATASAAIAAKIDFNAERQRVGNLRVASAQLYAQGRTTEARRAEEREAAGGDPFKLRALDIRNRREDQLQAQDIRARTAESAARANGQAGVGGVLAIAEEIQTMYRDAGDDPEKKKNVRAYATARIAEERRNLRQPSRIFGLAEYHDAIQTGIGQGGATNQAVGLLNKLERGGMSNAYDALIPAALKDAAQNLKQAAGKFRFVGVIGGSN